MQAPNRFISLFLATPDLRQLHDFAYLPQAPSFQLLTNSSGADSTAGKM